MNGESYKPSKAEIDKAEEIVALSPDLQEADELRKDEKDLDRRIKNLPKQRDALQREIKSALLVFGMDLNEVADLGEAMDSPKFTEGIKEAKKIIQEINQKLKELERLEFRLLK